MDIEGWARKKIEAQAREVLEAGTSTFTPFDPAARYVTFAGCKIKDEGASIENLYETPEEAQEAFVEAVSEYVRGKRMSWRRFPQLDELGDKHYMNCRVWAG